MYPNYILNISEVYVDSDKNTYSALDFNRMSILDLLPALFAPKGLQAGYKSWQLGLQGNMFGDGWQNGGCLVVEKGGGNEPLLYYIQEKAPDQVSNEEVLKVISLSEIKFRSHTCFTKKRLYRFEIIENLNFVFRHSESRKVIFHQRYQ